MDASSRQGHGGHKSVEGGRIDLRNCALLALLILTWAVSWPVIKIGVREMPPLWFGVLRYAIATLCVLLVTSTTHRFFTTPPKADWPLILVSASFQMAAYSALTAVALVALPPGRASVLAFSTPIWVVSLAAWWLNERISAPAVLGVIVGLGGVFAIASPSLALDHFHHLLAYLLLMCASAAWAISIVFVRHHGFTASALALAPWQMLVAVALLLPLALSFEGLPPSIGWTGAACLAFVGPISTGLPYRVWSRPVAISERARCPWRSWQHQASDYQSQH